MKSERYAKTGNIIAIELPFHFSKLLFSVGKKVIKTQDVAFSFSRETQRQVARSWQWQYLINLKLVPYKWFCDRLTFINCHDFTPAAVQFSDSMVNICLLVSFWFKTKNLQISPETVTADITLTICSWVILYFLNASVDHISFLQWNSSVRFSSGCLLVYVTETVNLCFVEKRYRGMRFSISFC